MGTSKVMKIATNTYLTSSGIAILLYANGVAIHITVKGIFLFLGGVQDVNMTKAQQLEPCSIK